MTDEWDPSQYARFAAERSQPFHDLVALVAPVPGGRVVDLGCGSGALTATARGCSSGSAPAPHTSIRSSES